MTTPIDDDQSNPESSSPRRISPIRKVTAVLVLLGAIAATAAYKYDQSHRPRILAGPMIQMPAPDSLTIIWKAHSPFGTGSATLAGPDGEETKTSTASVDGRYEITFDKLKPGTTCRYTVANGGLLSSHAAQSGPHDVSIAPARNQPIRFLAFGDSGIGSNTQTLLAETMVAEEPSLVVHTGDLIYPAGADKDYLPNFYRPYRDLIATAFFMPSQGNHDIATENGAPLLRQFVLPRNGPEGIEPERNYWFDFGPARFVALDTNMDAHGGVISLDQMKTTIAEWLKTSMKDCDASWRIVYFHQPFYTGSAHSAEGSAYVKEAYLDALEASGVDLVLCGHNHLYERTAPLLHDEIVEPGNGIVYITTGAGGAQRYPEGENPPTYIVKFDDSQFSFSCVDVTPDTLTFRQLGEGGRLIDEFELTK